MIASRSVNGATERTRPIYPYPLLARYSGQGDPKQASSYAPFDPARGVDAAARLNHVAPRVVILDWKARVSETTFLQRCGCCRRARRFHAPLLLASRAASACAHTRSAIG